VTDPALAAFAAAIAGELEDQDPPIRTETGASGTTWSRAGTTFAVLGQDGIELRLDRAVASAATRTPDTAPSARGPAWVRFQPRALDPTAVDRLAAWFTLAARRAGEASDAR
jgi:hypothetical protein